jgi:hypothetical protein
MSDQILKLGVPAGSLQEATAALFRKAGYGADDVTWAIVTYDERMGDAAQARVRDHFLGPRHLGQYVDLLERVL